MAPSPDDRSSHATRLIAWHNLRLTLLWIYQGSPGMSQGISTTQGFFAWLITKGSVRVTTPHGSILASAGQWLIHPPGSIDRSFSQNAQLLSLHFQAQWPDGSRLFELDRPCLVRENQASAMRDAALPLLEYVHQHFPDAYLFLPNESASAENYLRMQTMLIQWIIAFVDVMQHAGYAIKTMAEIDERIVRARHLIDQSVFARPIQEPQLAADVGLSVSQLNRLFVSHFNTTPRRYSDHRRITLAKRMLRTSGMSIKQLAYNMGFKQPSHFSSWFRQHTSLSPRQYRSAEVRPSQMSV